MNKSNTKENILYDSIFMMFKNSQKSTDDSRNQNIGYPWIY